MADNSQVSENKIVESVNLLSLNVVRRDGSISSFKSDKISDAIKKAFLAQTKIRNNKNKNSEIKKVETRLEKMKKNPYKRVDSENMTDVEKMDKGFNGKTFTINGIEIDF